MPPARMRGDGRKAKNPKKTMARLLGYMKPYTAVLVIVVVCICLTAIAQSISSKSLEYIIDDYPDENKYKNYIYFLISGGEIVYVGQANNGFYRRIKEHKRHFEFYNYVILELIDNDNVNDIEYFWINKCNPILNGILTPWEKYHCKSKMGFNGTVNDVLNYAK